MTRQRSHLQDIKKHSKEIMPKGNRKKGKEQVLSGGFAIVRGGGIVGEGIAMTMT